MTNIELVSASTTSKGLTPDVFKQGIRGLPSGRRALVAAGTVIPDEGAGPYDPSMYHANILGPTRGYKNEANFYRWKKEDQTHRYGLA